MLALVEGWVATVVDAAAGGRLPQSSALAEAIRRRRATGGPAERTFATLVGLELRPRRLREAAAIWQRPDRRLAGSSGRDAVWAHPGPAAHHRGPRRPGRLRPGPARAGYLRSGGRDRPGAGGRDRLCGAAAGHDDAGGQDEPPAARTRQLAMPAMRLAIPGRVQANSQDETRRGERRKRGRQADQRGRQATMGPPPRATSPAPSDRCAPPVPLPVAGGPSAGFSPARNPLNGCQSACCGIFASIPPSMQQAGRESCADKHTEAVSAAGLRAIHSRLLAADRPLTDTPCLGRHVRARSLVHKSGY